MARATRGKGTVARSATATTEMDVVGGIEIRGDGVFVKDVEEKGEIAGKIAQRPRIHTQRAQAQFAEKLRDPRPDAPGGDRFDPEQPRLVRRLRRHRPRHKPALVSHVEAAIAEGDPDGINGIYQMNGRIG